MNSCVQYLESAIAAPLHSLIATSLATISGKSRISMVSFDTTSISRTASSGRYPLARGSNFSSKSMQQSGFRVLNKGVSKTKAMNVEDD